MYQKKDSHLQDLQAIFNGKNYFEYTWSGSLNFSGRLTRKLHPCGNLQQSKFQISLKYDFINFRFSSTK